MQGSNVFKIGKSAVFLFSSEFFHCSTRKHFYNGISMWTAHELKALHTNANPTRWFHLFLHKVCCFLCIATLMVLSHLILPSKMDSILSSAFIISHRSFITRDINMSQISNKKTALLILFPGWNWQQVLQNSPDNLLPFFIFFFVVHCGQ